MSIVLGEIVVSARSLQPFPAVATKVLNLAQVPGSTPDDLIAVIQGDPALVGKILKLCNSAFYGFQREIPSLQEAGNMLGQETLVSLVMTSCAGRYISSAASIHGDKPNPLWARCVTLAVASHLLAQRHGKIDPDRAYTTGLLQNLGEIVLEQHLPEHQGQIEAEMKMGRSALSAEKVILGIHHAELGARLATHWQLPEFMVDTIRYHHEPQRASLDPTLTSITHLAETMTFASLDQESDTRTRYETSPEALEITGMSSSDFDTFEVDLSAELVRSSELLRA